MLAAWVTAFLTAAALALVGTPALRRLALRWDVLDHPEDRKVHTSPVPYLGGVAIIGGALMGLAVGPGIVPKIAAVTFGGCAVGSVGLLDDRRALSPLVRLLAQTAAATLAVGVGIRVHATHVTVVDIIITLVWIVGVTNAFNLLDNMDGLAGGVAAVTSLAVFALAALGGEVIVATLAIALTGACLGFLAYNVRPAAIFMGDGGALFLGYVLSIAALELDPDLLPPVSFLVPLIVLAVPLLDTTLVSYARLRRGRAVTHGGRDHLSHRLVARGLAPGRAVTLLVCAQALCGAVAVVVGRSAIGPLSGVVVAGVIVAVVLSLTARVRVYDIPVVGLSRRLRWEMVGGVAIIAALGGPAALAMARARTDLTTGANDARAAIRAAVNGDQDGAVARFTSAEAAFRRAGQTLNGLQTRPGVFVPVVATNLRAARTLASVGNDLSRDGQDLAHTIDPETLRVSGGHVPVEQFVRLRPQFRRGARMLERAEHRTDAVDRAFLVTPIRHALDVLGDRVHRAAITTHRAAVAAGVVPKLLGDTRPRRYFLAVQNNAELRATGGFIGNYGEIVCDHGQVTLGRFGRISDLNGTGASDRALHAPEDFVRRYGRFQIPDTWQNVNMSPDFPTVARVIADLYPQSGGQTIDGVVAVDSQGLASLLELTGPVAVPGWPEPLTADNVVRVTLHDEYERFTDRTVRAQFLGTAANAVWNAVTHATLPASQRLGATLGAAARGRHFLIATTDGRENAMLDTLGIAGRIDRVDGDGLMFVNQNAAGSKVDYYLHRSFDVHVTLAPDDRRLPRDAGVDTHVIARFENNAPSAGLATEAIGPFSPEFQAGENRTFVSLYTNHDFTHAEIDGHQASLESAIELKRHVYSSYIDVPSQQNRALSVDLAGAVPLQAGGWYALDLSRQATVNDDDFDVTVTVPRGWRIAATRGLARVSRRTAHVHIALRHDTTLAVQVARDGARGFFDELRRGAAR